MKTELFESINDAADARMEELSYKEWQAEETKKAVKAYGLFMLVFLSAMVVVGWAEAL